MTECCTRVWHQIATQQSSEQRRLSKSSQATQQACMLTNSTSQQQPTTAVLLSWPVTHHATLSQVGPTLWPDAVKQSPKNHRVVPIFRGPGTVHQFACCGNSFCQTAALSSTSRAHASGPSNRPSVCWQPHNTGPAGCMCVQDRVPSGRGEGLCAVNAVTQPGLHLSLGGTLRSQPTGHQAACSSHHDHVTGGRSTCNQHGTSSGNGCQGLTKP